MKDDKKTRNQLIKELQKARRQIATLEAAHTKADHDNLLPDTGETLWENNDIIEASPTVVFLWNNDKGWPVERVSQNVTRLFGHTAEDFVKGRVCYADVIHPDDLERVTSEVATNSAEDARSSFEHESYRIITKDGDVKWVDDLTSIRRNDTGLITHFQGIVLDITERKRAEEALLGEKLRLEEYIDSLPGLFYVFAEEQFVKWNNRWETVTGYSPEELGTMYGTDFFEGEDKTLIEERMLKVFHEGASEVEAELVTKDGRRIPYYFTGLRKILKGKEHLVGLGIDITERKLAEQGNALLQEQLQQSQKLEAIGRLAGGVAHDFNNVLCSIMGNASLVLSDMSTEDPFRAGIEEINTAAERAADLTQQLLAFSRKQIIEPKVISLSQLIKNLHPMLVRLLGEDIILKTVPQKGIGRVRVDPGQIEQIVLNLAINARDAMPDGGDLLIETADVSLDDDYSETHSRAQTGPHVMLAVSDTGHGMSAEIREKIFDPFFTTKELGQGTGLGLATVFGIVEQSGGRIEVYSEPDQGSTFKVYFPRVEKKSEPLERPQRTQIPGGIETVLVVEDEQMVRKLAQKLLERLGYQVLAAGDGPKAIALVQQHEGPIHLLLTDVVMPHMNGRELAENLTGLRPGLKVLFTSGYTHNVISHKGVLAEGMQFIAKPYTLNELAHRVRQVLDEAGHKQG